MASNTVLSHMAGDGP